MKTPEELAAYYRSRYLATWEHRKARRAERKLELAAYDKAYRAADPERFKQYKRDNPEIARRATKKWKQENRDAVRNYDNKRKAGDPNFKARKRLTSSTSQVLRNGKGIRKGAFLRVLGCSAATFRDHLQSQFKTGMNWENYGCGSDRWSIDHVMPLSAFDLNNRQHYLLAAYYLNTQPLWHTENMAKGNKIAAERVQ